MLSKYHREARKLHERQSPSCIAWRGYRAAAHGDRCPQCCLFFVSVAHAVVLENAGTLGLYTKRCFSSRLHSLVLHVLAPESKERGAQHGAKHFEGGWCCEANRVGYSWRNLSVLLPKFDSTTGENPEGTGTSKLHINYAPRTDVFHHHHLSTNPH